jgi:hypothetical protein
LPIERRREGAHSTFALSFSNRVSAKEENNGGCFMIWNWNPTNVELSEEQEHHEKEMEEIVPAETVVFHDSHPFITITSH